MSDSERREHSPAAAAAASPHDAGDAGPAVAADAELEDAQARPSEDGAAASEPPAFEPLFTLLTNTTTNTTVHPRVHYVFTDDDPAFLSNAAPIDDPSHTTIIVDLATPPAPTGQDADANPTWSVSWASSLSKHFAVTNSQLAVQHGEGEGDGSTMLRIEGVEREPIDTRPDSLPSSGSGAALGKEDVEGLADEFRRRMGVLKRVVAENEKRRDVIGLQAGETMPVQENQSEEDTARRDEADVADDK